jgi:hypothetical protein
MDNFLDDLKNSWKQEKSQSGPAIDAQELLDKAEAFKKHSIKFQYGNVLILSIVLILYIIFFYQFLLYGTTLSKAGFLIMAIPLALRIVAELVSITKGKKIKPDDNAVQHNEEMIKYTSFRKWMHGPVTYTIIFLYTVGYYFIMVQFSDLVPGWLIIVMCVGYPVAAFLIIKQVRKSIKNEMDQLKKLSEYREEFKGE